jgi:hypothetical protein
MVTDILSKALQKCKEMRFIDGFSGIGIFDGQPN